MVDLSLAGALLAGLISFLSPCVLPLVPGYISVLSGIGMEELREGDVSKGGLLLSAFSLVLGFSVVFISFGASASAVGSFLRQKFNTHSTCGHPNHRLTAKQELAYPASTVRS